MNLSDLCKGGIGFFFFFFFPLKLTVGFVDTLFYR